MLLISAEFREGSKAQANNAELKFLYSVPDSLGNPKQIRKRKPAKWFWDPEIADFTADLASFFVLVKSEDPLAKDFMSLQERKPFNRLRRNSAESPKKRRAKHKKPNVQKIRARFFFYRRQRKNG
jgi:hypothetical protein